MPITKITPLQFYDVVSKFVEEYGEEARQASETAIQETAKDVSKDLKKAGSFGGKGEYRRAIGVELDKSRLGIEAHIGAKKYSGLTHLLEFGHAKRNGGRTTAYNYVAPINDTVEERYMKKLEELLK